MHPSFRCVRGTRSIRYDFDNRATCTRSVNAIKYHLVVKNLTAKWISRTTSVGRFRVHRRCLMPQQGLTGVGVGYKHYHVQRIVCYFKGKAYLNNPKHA